MMNLKIILPILIACFFVACSGTKPTDIGVSNGLFKACPSSPNCVSTQAEAGDEKHSMSPITYTGDVATAKAKLVSVINGMDRTKITENTATYIHSEFTSKTMKFVDDVEFYFDDAAKLIHFRSASRKGHSDMGVNRKRMDAIISAFK